MKKYNSLPTDRELQYMIHILDSVKDANDDYVENAFKNFYAFLVMNNKQNILNMDLSSPYMKYIGTKVEFSLDELEDKVIEAIN